MKKAVLGVLALVNAGLAALTLFPAASEAHAVYEASLSSKSLANKRRSRLLFSK
ncbi:hypothetical protein L3476_26590 [Paenibacillus thiaminolyticus]|uniref:hypothetical protein n=1 Tax=Paenibacillus thiaminolyticus TaxID=49283 RepID=UPI0013F5F62F|nr:hypothetical protein [Paenibacillus thiaminolyticus]MDG0874089.1 hypothetical protein [Paenibacillus thiaminolyticus]NGP58207.1 hypothetical protein [Paenibacillus thiaminolyticus]WCR26729.1 hypothetical protein L3476_26590 [Paenibacillus thiaminolyticus]